MNQSEDDTPWSTDQMRQNSTKWTLEGDAKLLLYLKAFSKNLHEKSKNTKSKMDAMISTLDYVQVSLGNSTNRFHALQHSQFVESRVYEEDIAVSEQKQEDTVVSEEPRLDPATIAKQAVLCGIKLMETEYVKVPLQQNHGETTEDIRYHYVPKDRYQHRPLPPRIGSKEFLDSLAPRSSSSTSPMNRTTTTTTITTQGGSNQSDTESSTYGGVRNVIGDDRSRSPSNASSSTTKTSTSHSPQLLAEGGNNSSSRPDVLSQVKAGPRATPDKDLFGQSSDDDDQDYRHKNRRTSPVKATSEHDLFSDLYRAQSKAQTNRQQETSYPILFNNDGPPLLDDDMNDNQPDDTNDLFRDNNNDDQQMFNDKKSDIKTKLNTVFREQRHDPRPRVVNLFDDEPPEFENDPKAVQPSTTRKDRTTNLFADDGVDSSDDDDDDLFSSSKFASNKTTSGKSVVKGDSKTQKVGLFSDVPPLEEKGSGKSRRVVAVKTKHLSEERVTDETEKLFGDAVVVSKDALKKSLEEKLSRNINKQRPTSKMADVQDGAGDTNRGAVSKKSTVRKSNKTNEANKKIDLFNDDSDATSSNDEDLFASKPVKNLKSKVLPSTSNTATPNLFDSDDDDADLKLDSSLFKTNKTTLIAKQSPTVVNLFDDEPPLDFGAVAVKKSSDGKDKDNLKTKKDKKLSLFSSSSSEEEDIFADLIKKNDGGGAQKISRNENIANDNNRSPSGPVVSSDKKTSEDAKSKTTTVIKDNTSADVNKVNISSVVDGVNRKVDSLFDSQDFEVMKQTTDSNKTVKSARDTNAIDKGANNKSENTVSTTSKNLFGQSTKDNRFLEDLFEDEDDLFSTSPSRTASQKQVLTSSVNSAKKTNRSTDRNVDVKNDAQTSQKQTISKTEVEVMAVTSRSTKTVNEAKQNDQIETNEENVDSAVIKTTPVAKPRTNTVKNTASDTSSPRTTGVTSTKHESNIISQVISDKKRTNTTTTTTKIVGVFEDPIYRDTHDGTKNVTDVKSAIGGAVVTSRGVGASVSNANDDKTPDVIVVKSAGEEIVENTFDSEDGERATEAKRKKSLYEEAASNLALFGDEPPVDLFEDLFGGSKKSDSSNVAKQQRLSLFDDDDDEENGGAVDFFTDKMAANKDIEQDIDNGGRDQPQDRSFGIGLFDNEPPPIDVNFEVPKKKKEVVMSSLSSNQPQATSRTNIEAQPDAKSKKTVKEILMSDDDEALFGKTLADKNGKNKDAGNTVLAAGSNIGYGAKSSPKLPFGKVGGGLFNDDEDDDDDDLFAPKSKSKISTAKKPPRTGDKNPVVRSDAGNKASQGKKIIYQSSSDEDLFATQKNSQKVFASDAADGTVRASGDNSRAKSGIVKTDRINFDAGSSSGSDDENSLFASAKNTKKFVTRKNSTTTDAINSAVTSSPTTHENRDQQQQQDGGDSSSKPPSRTNARAGSDRDAPGKLSKLPKLNIDVAGLMPGARRPTPSCSTTTTSSTSASTSTASISSQLTDASLPGRRSGVNNNEVGNDTAVAVAVGGIKLEAGDTKFNDRRNIKDNDDVDEARIVRGSYDTGKNQGAASGGDRNGDFVDRTETLHNNAVKERARLRDSRRRPPSSAARREAARRSLVLVEEPDPGQEREKGGVGSGKKSTSRGSSGSRMETDSADGMGVLQHPQQQQQQQLGKAARSSPSITAEGAITESSHRATPGGGGGGGGGGPLKTAHSDDAADIAGVLSFVPPHQQQQQQQQQQRQQEQDTEPTDASAAGSAAYNALLKSSARKVDQEPPLVTTSSPKKKKKSPSPANDDDDDDETISGEVKSAADPLKSVKIAGSTVAADDSLSEDLVSPSTEEDDYFKIVDNDDDKTDEDAFNNRPSNDIFDNDDDDDSDVDRDDCASPTPDVAANNGDVSQQLQQRCDIKTKKEFNLIGALLSRQQKRHQQDDGDDENCAAMPEDAQVNSASACGNDNTIENLKDERVIHEMLIADQNRPFANESRSDMGLRLVPENLDIARGSSSRTDGATDYLFTPSSLAMAADTLDKVFADANSCRDEVSCSTDDGGVSGANSENKRYETITAVSSDLADKLSTLAIDGSAEVLHAAKIDRTSKDVLFDSDLEDDVSLFTARPAKNINDDAVTHKGDAKRPFVSEATAAGKTKGPLFSERMMTAKGSRSNMALVANRNHGNDSCAANNKMAPAQKLTNVIAGRTKTKKSDSLFGDSDDDDAEDLFKSAKVKASKSSDSVGNKTVGAAEKDVKKSSTVVTSLFGDSDEEADDLFKKGPAGLGNKFS